MRIGFIGLGRMGSGMAASLLEAGHELTVFNRTAEKAEDLGARGAAVATRVAEACRGDAVVTMLSDDAAVEAVVFGEGGVLASLPAGATHVSCSTIGVALSDRLAAAHAGRGQRYVSAPVFGRPEAAAARQLFIVAAGEVEAVRGAMPLLEAMGRGVSVLSDVPSRANVVKLSGNFLIAAVIESLGEALALVGKAGVDRKRFVEFLTSSLFDAPVYRSYGAILAADAPGPVGFAAPLGLKDVRLALAAAEALRVPMPLASLVRDRLVTLLATGGEAMDWSAFGRLALRDAGLERESARP
jgi:3-hydroxyisobutyrate dehydrogenase-like beta-hydroxyacid dehydrogenase